MYGFSALTVCGNPPHSLGRACTFSAEDSLALLWKASACTTSRAPLHSDTQGRDFLFLNEELRKSWRKKKASWEPTIPLCFITVCSNTLTNEGTTRSQESVVRKRGIWNILSWHRELLCRFPFQSDPLRDALLTCRWCVEGHWHLLVMWTDWCWIYNNYTGGKIHLKWLLNADLYRL